MKSYSWLRLSSCIFVFASICINHAFSKSETDQTYTKHCSSVIPRYDITTRSNDESLPSLSTSYFTGGDSLMRVESGRSYYYVEKNLRLRLRPDYYETTAAGIYAVEGFLHIRFPYSSDYTPANYSYSGYHRRRNQTKESIMFPMTGFWSEKSRKLCMVGSAPWRGNDRDYVLKLQFDEENPTIYTGVVSGSLESTSPANSPAYFETVLIFSFVEISSYKYSLLPKQLGGVFPSRKDESLSLDAAEFCLEMEVGLRSLELEYATECAGRRHRCSPVGSGDEFFPNYLSLISIQCLKGEKKARFLATFSDHPSYSNHNDYFSLGSTVIGEATWDDKNKRIIAVACEILDPSTNLGKAVGNCSMRLSLRHPSVLTMRNAAKIVGEIWSSKSVGDSGYFTQINLTTADDNRAVALPELRYEYTEMKRVRKLCTEKKAGKKGDMYPDAQSYDMRFDMSVKNGKGEEVGWASATPSWVENDSYQGGNDMFLTPVSIAFPDADAESADVVLEQEKHVSRTHPTKMSYEIRIHTYYLVNSSSNISSRTPGLNWTTSLPGRVDIIAEGLYDDRNGQLCMVGCRKLVQNSTNTFKDCELFVEFELPPLNGQRGGLSKGMVKSTRSKTDALHFDDLKMESTAYYHEEAKRSIWRMDLEIAMVLISNTLVCIFVALQIFQVKRHPEVPSFVSIVMVVILSLGHMLPLLLNFEAVFSGNRKKSTLELGSGGRLEANEVAVRVITMVVLLLLLRLLQLVWTAKQKEGSGERKAGVVSLLLYTFGGLITLLVNWMRETSVWGDLRSYAGLILDGFLVPQVVLNVLRGSAEKVLCHPFYVGTSAVRLVPHAYNQYRAHNYPKFDLNATYYYANPAADLYSTAWDIIIPCGIVTLAVVVFVQQRHGGRCILPRRFRDLEMYEKVPTADNQ